MRQRRYVVWESSRAFITLLPLAAISMSISGCWAYPSKPPIGSTCGMPPYQAKQLGVAVDSRTGYGHLAIYPVDLMISEIAPLDPPIPNALLRKRMRAADRMTFRELIRAVAQMYDVDITIPQDPQMEREPFQSIVLVGEREVSLLEELTYLVTLLNETGLPVIPGMQTDSITTAIVKEDRIEIVRTYV